jgi:hypothetical protein
VALTPIFNDAAHGGGNQTPTEGPSPLAPSPPTSAGASAGTDDQRNPINQQNDLPKRATVEFQSSTVDQPAPELYGLHPGMKYRTEPEALALLEMLEAGRVKPALKHNLKPSPLVEKAVHEMHEGWREKFIRELQSELAATDNLDEHYMLDEGFDDEFGPTF